MCVAFDVRVGLGVVLCCVVVKCVLCVLCFVLLVLFFGVGVGVVLCVGVGVRVVLCFVLWCCVVWCGVIGYVAAGETKIFDSEVEERL